MRRSNKSIERLEGFDQFIKWGAVGIGSLAICLLVAMVMGNSEAILPSPSSRVGNFSWPTISLAKWRLAHASPQTKPVQPGKKTPSPSIGRASNGCLPTIYGFRAHILVSAIRPDLRALP
jgi:hypothetical protein